MYNTKALLTAEFKKLGYNSRKISVRKQCNGYSDAFYVTIKDINIDIEQIEKICKRFESYEVDERTQEILCGGNTFVFVEYDKKIPENDRMCNELNRMFKHKNIQTAKAEVINGVIHVNLPCRTFLEVYPNLGYLANSNQAVFEYQY